MLYSGIVYSPTSANRGASATGCLLRKRAIIDTIINQLKNISQIEHTRHRSPVNFMAHLVAGLIAYCFQPSKPSLGLDKALVLAPVIHN